MLDLLKTAIYAAVGCRHWKRGPLITCRPGQPRKGVAALTGTYCVCLGCGKEFAYDWEQMRLFDPEPSRFKAMFAKATQVAAEK